MNDNSENSTTVASLLGYKNGSLGPKFYNKLIQATESASWPKWHDQLSLSQTPQKNEGGLRTKGIFKSGSKSQPLITFVTVVRNNEKTLSRTIESVQRQTYANVEHIILDGASTDSTLDIIHVYAEKVDYFASEPDRGLYDALNKAIPLARGDLICVLNSDDWLEPSAAETAAKLYSESKENELLILTSAVVESGNQRVVWEPAFVHPGSFFMCPNVCHNAIFATRSAYELSGPYDSSMKIAADTKWVLCNLVRGSAFIYSKDITVNFSLGGTSSNFAKHSLEFIQIFRENFVYLSEEEAIGLFHCFFVFKNRDNGIKNFNPILKTPFISELMAKYADHHEFILALSWASAATLRHPDDESHQRELTTAVVIKNVVKFILSKTPTFREFARRVYLNATSGRQPNV